MTPAKAYPRIRIMKRLMSFSERERVNYFTRNFIACGIYHGRVVQLEMCPLRLICSRACRPSPTCWGWGRGYRSRWVAGVCCSVSFCRVSPWARRPLGNWREIISTLIVQYVTGEIFILFSGRFILLGQSVLKFHPYLKPNLLWSTHSGCPDFHATTKSHGLLMVWRVSKLSMTAERSLENRTAFRASLR